MRLESPLVVPLVIAGRSQERGARWPKDRRSVARRVDGLLVAALGLALTRAAAGFHQNALTHVRRVLLELAVIVNELHVRPNALARRFLPTKLRDAAQLNRFLQTQLAHGRARGLRRLNFPYHCCLQSCVLWQAQAGK